MILLSLDFTANETSASRLNDKKKYVIHLVYCCNMLIYFNLIVVWLHNAHSPADHLRVIGLQSLLCWSAELSVFINDSQPERCQLIVVVTFTVSMTFDDWLRSEFFQTRAW